MLYSWNELDPCLCVSPLLSSLPDRLPPLLCFHSKSTTFSLQPDSSQLPYPCFCPNGTQSRSVLRGSSGLGSQPTVLSFSQSPTKPQLEPPPVAPAAFSSQLFFFFNSVFVWTAENSGYQGNEPFTVDPDGGTTLLPMAEMGSGSNLAPASEFWSLLACC